MSKHLAPLFDMFAPLAQDWIYLIGPYRKAEGPLYLLLGRASAESLFPFNTRNVNHLA